MTYICRGPQLLYSGPQFPPRLRPLTFLIVLCLVATSTVA